MSDNENKNTYPEKLCTLAEYFKLYQDRAVGPGATEIEVLGANMTFVGGFQAALVAMERIQDLPTDHEKEMAWNSLWDQINNFSFNIESEFQRLAVKTYLN